MCLSSSCQLWYVLTNRVPSGNGSLAGSIPTSSELPRGNHVFPVCLSLDEPRAREGITESIDSGAWRCCSSGVIWSGDEHRACHHLLNSHHAVSVTVLSAALPKLHQGKSLRALMCARLGQERELLWSEDALWEASLPGLLRKLSHIQVNITNS